MPAMASMTIPGTPDCPDGAPSHHVSANAIRRSSIQQQNVDDSSARQRASSSMDSNRISPEFKPTTFPASFAAAIPPPNDPFITRLPPLPPPPGSQRGIEAIAPLSALGGATSLAGPPPSSSSPERVQDVLHENGQPFHAMQGVVTAAASSSPSELSSSGQFPSTTTSSISSTRLSTATPRSEPVAAVSPPLNAALSSPKSIGTCPSDKDIANYEVVFVDPLDAFAPFWWPAMVSY